MSRTKKFIAGAGIAVGLIYAAGEPHEVLNNADVEALAVEERLDRYRNAESAGSLLVMQYAQDERLSDKIVIGDMQNGDGIIGNIQGMWGQEYKFPQGQACLDDSEYDVENDIEGQYSRKLYSVPGKAEWADADKLVVHPAPEGESDQVLTFNVDENNVLSSANKETTDTLRSFGCSPQHETPRIVETDPDSPLALGSILEIEPVYIYTNEDLSRAA